MKALSKPLGSSIGSFVSMQQGMKKLRSLIVQQPKMVDFPMANLEEKGWTLKPILGEQLNSN